MVVNRITTMGARGGGGGRSGMSRAGFRGQMWAMKKNQGQELSNWNQALQSVVGGLTHDYRGKRTKLKGAARKNSLNTLKQLVAMHPNAYYSKALKAGKFFGFDPAWLK